MKVNMFKPSQNGFNTLLNHLGQTVKVNNVPTKAVITNVQLNENYDERYLNTQTETKRGQHIAFDNRDWYIMSQVSTKRYDNYKAVIKQADHYVRFNLSTYNQQSMTYSKYEIYELPCLMGVVKGFGMEGNQVVMNIGEIEITLADNELTRRVYQSFLNKTNHNLFIDGREYAFEGFHFDKKGLVTITLQTTAKSKNEYGINWMTGASISDFDYIIDKGFYGDKLDVRTNEPPVVEPEPEPEPEPPVIDPDPDPPTTEPETPVDPTPDPTVTNVEMSITTTDETTTLYGTVNVSFTAQDGAKSYRLRLYDASTDTMMGEEQYVTDNSKVVSFADEDYMIVVGTYYVTIEAYIDSAFLKPKRSEILTINMGEDDGSGWGGW